LLKKENKAVVWMHTGLFFAGANSKCPFHLVFSLSDVVIEAQLAHRSVIPNENNAR